MDDVARTPPLTGLVIAMPLSLALWAMIVLPLIG